MGQTNFRSGIFISYSHADHDWLSRLQIHLAPHVRGEKLDLWDDTKIAPGTDWAAEIDQALGKARAAVLLVSPDFLASEFIAKVELPAILGRAGNDLTIIWIPIRPSAWDITPLKNFQAAYDPHHALSGLPPVMQDEALVAISKQIASAVGINAMANAFRILDDFDPQVSAFLADQPEPEKPVLHSYQAEQVEASIRLADHGQTRRFITAKELERLDPDSQELIRTYELTMKELFKQWTDLQPKRMARDTTTRHQAREESNKVRKELCGQLTKLLDFIEESMGVPLSDHYHHVRYICSSP